MLHSCAVQGQYQWIAKKKSTGSVAIMAGAFVISKASIGEIGSICSIWLKFLKMDIFPKSCHFFNLQGHPQRMSKVKTL